MGYRICYWPQHDVYCYPSDLTKFTCLYGHNYSWHEPSEFFSEIWIDKEEDK